MCDPECDDALELQAQQKAEAALASLPEGARAAKLDAVKSGILKRLRTEASKGAAAQGQPSKPTAPRSGPEIASVPANRKPVGRKAQGGGCIQKIHLVEACGDEPWFADMALRQQMLEKTVAAHSEQKILVGHPPDEIKRICPTSDRVLGAGAVLRLGGAHHGGFGEADVKYAYRQLSRALHPDKNPGIPEAPDAFKRLSDAADELKEVIRAAQKMLQKIARLVGAAVTPEMLERPQVPLFAEASRLLAAVLALSGEGCVPLEVRQRAPSSVAACPHLSGCGWTVETLQYWYNSDELLDLFASTPLRISYDCAPKRFRAQFLSLLNRAAAVEAAKNDSCVRGPWQAILAQFPEISMLRALLDRLRCRLLLEDGPKSEHEEDASTATIDPNSVSKWAKGWRNIISSVLPCPDTGALSLTNREIRLMAHSLWLDVVDWMSKENSETARALELFVEDKSNAARLGNSAVCEISWAFLPASDILLCVGEGLVGITIEGIFLGSGEPHDVLPFRAAVRREKFGSEKRGLAAPQGERKVKQAKLSKSPTRIVLLTNLVGAGEVDDDLNEETAEEASKYGKLLKCTIREQSDAPDNEAVRIFLEFEKVEAASKAYKDMNGRYFDGRTVKARFFDEARYNKGDLDRKSSSRILLMTNLVSTEDLDEDLEDETIREVEKFGKVLRCLAREIPGAPDDEAVRVFVEFAQSEDASRALNELNGKVFGDRELKVRFFDEDLYKRGELLPTQDLEGSETKSQVAPTTFV